ncbi:MAG TPA: hypothetical protein VK066_16010 [Chloroflexota bacterium]|nr:hypothetical protein [Chloroflexota bacterium]
MEDVVLAQPAACPPHHWLIAKEATDRGIVERWSCQRCASVRERVVSKRRLPAESTKRYVASESDLTASLFGSGGGERVA